MTDNDVAPENLLKIIRCKCKMASKNMCSTNLCFCRKSGIKCVAACEGCSGNNCHNVEEIILEENYLFHQYIFDPLVD